MSFADRIQELDKLKPVIVRSCQKGYRSWTSWNLSLSDPVKKDTGVGQVEACHCQILSKRRQEFDKLKPVNVISCQKGYRSWTLSLSDPVKKDTGVNNLKPVNVICCQKGYRSCTVETCHCTRNILSEWVQELNKLKSVNVICCQKGYKSWTSGNLLKSDFVKKAMELDKLKPANVRSYQREYRSWTSSNVMSDPSDVGFRKWKG